MRERVLCWFKASAGLLFSWDGLRFCMHHRFPSVLGVILVATSGLAAQPQHDPAAARPLTDTLAQKPLSEALTGPARVAYESGRLLLEANDSATAHAKFKEAYDLSRSPRLLWNMAACSKLQRHYAMAVSELEHFLSDGAGQLTPDQESRARELLETLRVVVAPVTVRVRPEDSLLFVDGESRSTTDGAFQFLADVGRHEFRAELMGHTPAARSLDLNDTKAVVVELAPAPIVPDSMLNIATLAGAAVEVDGKAFSVGTREAVVAPGAHRVRVWARDYKPWSTDVILAVGEHKAITAALEPDDKPNWWVIGTGSVLALAGVGVGAYYLFKPESPAAPAPIVLQPTSGVGGTITLP